MQTPLINRHPLFWEISPEKIPSLLNDNIEWVIVRVFEYGTMNDIFDVIDFYGETLVKGVLENSQLNPVASTIAFVIPKKNASNATSGMRNAPAN